MNTLYATLALFTILATGSVAVPAFAQEFVDAVTVSTDKEAYEDGETITVSGSVRERLSGYDVTLQVFAANGNLVTAQQLPVSDENTFGIDLTAGGPLWRSAGEYTIKVLYGTATRTAETSFEFGGSGDVIPGPKVPQFSLANPDDGSVGYKIKGGKILSITPDVQAKSLIVEIETTSDGEVTLIIPRGILDARLGPDGMSGEDDSFFVLVDGAEVDFEETTTSEDRTLTIEFEDGNTQIEIIGTFVIPEFGTIAVIILAVAIVSIVAISRSRLSILPKY
ncbi:PEFG-CTERM sorting domain-containing protein [Candidatus Nitrosotenuis aquarius]|uniref:PEFG-CTERM sorting domain-containing protein n=1 Tax=Candidatus Nitrosotenuis aquarius TaxID=1846278 RepID=UPI000C1E8B92|nr:PEFG-CTERM sorting domain-containing protein [Candidatus Nitrosotenuis aquarius]